MLPHLRHFVLFYGHLAIEQLFERLAFGDDRVKARFYNDAICELGVLERIFHEEAILVFDVGMSHLSLVFVQLLHFLLLLDDDGGPGQEILLCRVTILTLVSCYQLRSQFAT